MYVYMCICVNVHKQMYFYVSPSISLYKCVNQCPSLFLLSLSPFLCAPVYIQTIPIESSISEACFVSSNLKLNVSFPKFQNKKTLSLIFELTHKFEEWTVPVQ